MDLAASPRCVVAAGGTIETALLPGRLLALRADFGLDVGCALSPGALDFVTTTAIHGVTGRPPYVEGDRFAGAVPRHLAWSAAEVLVLHPASARVLAECAAGSVTDPVTRLAAFTPRDRIVVAAAIHPQMDPRPYRRHLDALRELGCTILGGDDLHVGWPELERHLVARLGLVRMASPDVVRLDELLRRT